MASHSDTVAAFDEHCGAENRLATAVLKTEDEPIIWPSATMERDSCAVANDDRLPDDTTRGGNTLRYCAPEVSP
jgi:hypothetical protein